MTKNDIKKSLVGRQVYYKLAKSKFDCPYLTPRKLYTVIEHIAGSDLIWILDNTNATVATGVVYPSAHLGEKATFSLKRKQEAK